MLKFALILGLNQGGIISDSITRLNYATRSHSPIAIPQTLGPLAPILVPILAPYV
jgi:hypothetical protein